MLKLKNGRYHCIEVLGEGSMGRTYLATDAETDQQVAVKALYPSRLATIKDLELFEREASILQRLEHDQIPAYVDAFGQGDDEAMCYYIVQSYVEGQDLRDHLDAGGRFSEEELIELMLSLTQILVYIHACDPTVVHRDLKPGNIILDETRRRPSLVDFGAVREVVRLTMGGGSTIIGTFGYMPPEQLMGRAEPASDLYALGITALECLTRRTPTDLHGEDAGRMIDEVNVTDDFRRILRRLCEPRLDARYQSAQQLADDLESIRAKDQLIHAPKIERAVERRLRDEARELARSTSTTVSVIAGALTLFILGAIVIGGFLAARTLIETFEAPLVMALFLSHVAVVVPMIYLILRYTHDAWFAPDHSWIKTRGRTINEGRDHYLREVWNVGYEIDLPGRSFKPPHTIATIHGMDNVFDHPRIGAEFDVYYPPGNPETHCRIDIFDPIGTGVTTDHHFDHKLPHHPA